MVKYDKDTPLLASSYSTFEEFLEGFYETASLPLIKNSKKHLSEVNLEELQAISALQKLNTAAVNAYSSLCTAVYLGKKDCIPIIEAFLRFIPKKLHSKYTKLAGANKVPSEKLATFLKTFLESTQIIMQCSLPDDFSGFLLKKVALLMNIILASACSANLIKLYCKLCFSSNNIEDLKSLVLSKSKGSIDITSMIIYNFSYFSTGPIENLQEITTKLIEALVLNLPGLRKAMSMCIETLDYYMNNSLLTYTSAFFNTLRIIALSAISSPKDFIKISNKIGDLCMKYISIDHSSKYFPLKMQVCCLVVDLEEANNDKLYIPGVVLQIYHIFNSSLLSKRAKTQRITNIDIDGRITLKHEEESSEFYKNWIADQGIAILKKHMNFLVRIDCAHLQPLKAYLTPLSKNTTNLYFKQKLGHLLKSFNKE